MRLLLPSATARGRVALASGALAIGALLLTTLAAAQTKPLPCPDFGERVDWQRRLRGFAGGGQTDQTYAAPRPELRDYQIFRDASENLLVSYRGGLRLELSHPTGLSFRGGADYHVYRSRTRVGRVDGPGRDNTHQTLAPTLGLGFHRWFGPVAPYAFAEGGYELRVATDGVLNAPQLPDPALPIAAFDSEPYIARAPGLQYGATVGLDVAVGPAWFAGASASYTQLAGLGSDAEPLAYDQTALTAAVSLGLRF